MGDLIFLAVVIGFFAIAVAYVYGCARIVGNDELVRVPDTESDTESADEAGPELGTAVR
jgi:hypothetical protein